MNEKVKQPYKDIREHLKDSNFNNVVMEAFELMCGETVEMDLQFDNYPMARTKYLETEASKNSIEFSKKYHGTSVVVKLALEQREELLKWKDSQQDLIKGKDEYIAKLCNDRAELKEHEKELIAEQHRLFDLAKEQENELKELREFAKKIAKLPNFLENNHIKDNNYKIRNSKYDENERCWLYQDVRCSTNDKNGWFLNERDGAMLFSKESAEETIKKFKQWGFKGAEDLIIVLEYKQAHDRYVLFKKVVEKYGK